MRSSRIGTVVRIRRLQERVARGAVAGARRAAVESETRRSTTLHRVEALAAAAPEVGRALIAHRRLVDGGVRAVVEAGQAVVAAGDRVENTLDDWAGANRRLDGVQRLAARRTAAAQVELDRRALADIDDLTVTRWRRASGDLPTADPTDGGS